MTGAAHGVGEAVARRLAAEGAAVVLTDIDAVRVEAVAAEVTDAGGSAVGIQADVADRDSVRRAIEATDSFGQPLAIVVNIAGQILPAMLPKMKDEDFRSVLDVHLLGTFACCQEALTRMPDDGSGRIINTTSAAGLTGTIGQVNYAAAKAGIVGLTKAMAKELGRRSITANAVAPIAATAMTETIRTDSRFAEKQLDKMALRRWAAPEEIAGTYAFLASDDAGYITGQVICVDGGLVI